MNPMVLTSLLLGQLLAPPLAIDPDTIGHARDPMAVQFWSVMAALATPPAPGPAEAPACPDSDDVLAEIEPGFRANLVGYESEARQICALDPAPETLPPVDPTSYEYVVTKEDLVAAKTAGQNVLDYLFEDLASTVSRFNRLDPKFIRAGRKLLVPELADGQTEYTPLPTVYPPALAHRKYVVIDLKRQFLGLYECGRLAASYPVSSGRSDRGPKGENFRTPTGQYKVHAKHKDAKSSKYPEPNGGAPMPYAVNFIFPGYWMHGGDLVGFPASHGCVRLLYTDAPKIFGWAEIGIPVRVVKSLD